MSIFDDHQPTDGEMHVIDANSGLYLGSTENPPISGDAKKLNARDYSPGAPLEVHGVGSHFDDDFIPGLGVGLNAQLIRHGPRGHEESGFFPQKTGDLFLESVDRWVLPEDIIPHLCFKHGFAHLGGWLGYSIAAQVNESIHARLLY
jgi:hypothetical protein